MNGIGRTIHSGDTRTTWLSVGAVLLTVILGTGTTWLVVRSSLESTQNLAQEALNERASRVENAISHRLLAYEALLHAGAGLVDASWPLTRTEWRTFAERVQLAAIYPGVQGIGFAAQLGKLTPEQREWLSTSETAPVHLEHWDDPTAIVFLEPMDARNRAAIGFDMMTEPIRRAAMERARDRGEAALSGKVTLVQEIDENRQPGFLMYLPVYERGTQPTTVEERRSSLLGFVYSPFRAVDFLDALFESEELDVSMEVFDGAKPRTDALLYNRGHASEIGTDDLSTTRHLSVAGHTWTLRITGTADLMQSARRADWKTLLATGAGATLLLSGFVFSLALSRHRLRERLAADQLLIEQERDATTMLENSLEAFIVIDEDDRVLEWNRQAESIFGWSKADIIGRRLADTIIPVDSRDAHLEALRHFHTREHTLLGRRVEMPAVRIDGTEIFVALSIVSTLRRGQLVFFASLRDVTARRLEQEQLRQLNATLEQRVMERTRALEDAYRRLEITNRDLKAFTRSVSHDLQAPLRAINAYAQLLAQDLDTSAAPPVRKNLDAISATASKMQQIIENLLKLASIGQRALNKEPVMLGDLVQEVINELHPPKPVTFHMRRDELGAVLADAGLLQLALRNLISNAAKFSQTRQHPQVWIRVEAHGTERVYVIQDNGVGFDMNYSDKLFGIFQRLHSDREFEGTGLGLTIAKAVIDKHGGRIWADSKPDQGASFYFALPELEGQRSEAGLST